MRRISIAIVVFASLAFSQDTSVSSHTRVDVNGHRVVDGPDVLQSKSPNSSENTEIMQSVNGRSVPLEKREEHVLRDDATGRLIATLAACDGRRTSAVQAAPRRAEEINFTAIDSPSLQFLPRQQEAAGWKLDHSDHQLPGRPQWQDAGHSEIDHRCS